MLLKTSPVPDPLSDSVLSLDDEIKRILESSSVPDHEKVLKYEQAVQKYLTRVDQINSRSGSRDIHSAPPAPSRDRALPTTVPELEAKTVKLEQRVVDSLPKTLQNKGRLLVDHLKDSTELSWNDRGELIIKGETIAGSNVSDLIHETLRARKLSSEPTGWKPYADVLKQSNVPGALIGNKVRWAATSIDASPFKTPAFSTPASQSSKKTKTRHKPTFSTSTPHSSKNAKLQLKKSSVYPKSWLRYES